MWILLSRHLRTWAIFAIAVPLLSRVLGALGRAIERRHGPSALTHVLTWAQRLLARRARGPLATGPTPPGAGDRTRGTRAPAPDRSPQQPQLRPVTDTQP